MNNMSDMSFTQTSRAMTSSPLNRASNSYKPWWEVVSDYNKDTKKDLDNINKARDKAANKRQGSRVDRDGD